MYSKIAPMNSRSFLSFILCLFLVSTPSLSQEDVFKQLEEIVVKTSLYEYMFWDMCEECEEWPVQLNL